MDIKLHLEDLGLEEDDSEMELFALKHLNKSFVFNTMFAHFQEVSDWKKLKEWNDKYLQAFPNSINARINLINFYDQARGETTDYFKTIMADEIDCLLNDKPADIVLTDDYYNNLLVFLTHSYYQIGELDNAKKIFRYVLSFGNQVSIEELAFILRGIELDDFMQFNYVANLMLEKREIFEWHETVLGYLIDKRPFIKLHNPIAYHILNKKTIYFDQEDVNGLSAYDDNSALIYDDLIWVLHNGFLRQFAGEDFFKENFIFNTLLVAAHFRIRPFLEDFIYLLNLVPYGKNEDLFGNDFEEFCAPALVVLASENLTPIIEAYNTKTRACAYLVAVIVKIAAMDVKESQRAQNFMETSIKRLMPQENFAVLHIWILEIVANNMKGYEWLINHAIGEDWITKSEMDSIKNQEQSSNFYITEKSNIDDVNINDLLLGFHVIDKEMNPLNVDLEGLIDNVILITNDRNQDKEFIEKMEKNEFFTGDINALKGIDVEEALGLKSDSFKNDQPKVGRNSPCPCGSGRKYKVCCLSSN